MTAQWIKYDGSDEQIAELVISRFIVRDKLEERKCIYSNTDFDDQIDMEDWLANITAYWIIPDDPLREMKVRQAMTGQPVWVRIPVSYERYGYCYITYGATTTPDWNIPGAEYSFTEFKEEV